LFVDEIRELLGKGTFGKVFKCKDAKHNDSVALKVIRKINRYIDSAKIEADILKDIFGHQENHQNNQNNSNSSDSSSERYNYCVKMFSSFYYQGTEDYIVCFSLLFSFSFSCSSYPSLGYYVMVFERLGLSLYDLIKKNDFKRFPLEVVKDISRQLLQAMDFLKSVNLIHTGEGNRHKDSFQPSFNNCFLLKQI
jgi:serine/threonine protein kinase